MTESCKNAYTDAKYSIENHIECLIPNLLYRYELEKQDVVQVK